MAVLRSLLLLALTTATAALPSPKTRPISFGVKGHAFNRFITIWLENTNYAGAMADPNLSALAAKGITLTNYFAVSHPSEPNYVAAVGGDYFGMNNDNLNMIPSNISNIVDLFEERCISWGEYQEDLPYTGYAGNNFNNQITNKTDYVRKHNPLIIFNDVANNSARVQHIKNFTLFEQDLISNTLPQYMFITPNITNDGHDTNVTFAGTWTANFLNPLLTNPNFNTEGTLILITFDETSSSSVANRVYSILLGSAIPPSLVNTTDSNFYDHYSEISTLSANWDLSTLGRWDVGANVFSFVANTTGDQLRTIDNLTSIYLNASYPGIFNSNTQAPWPIPNTGLIANGRKVLRKVVDIWGSQDLQRCTTYTNALAPPSLMNPPILPAGC